MSKIASPPGEQNVPGARSPGQLNSLPRLLIFIGPQCAIPDSFHTSFAFNLEKAVRFWTNLHTPAVHQNPNHLFHIQSLTLQREMLPVFNVQRFFLKETESFFFQFITAKSFSREARILLINSRCMSVVLGARHKNFVIKTF